MPKTATSFMIRIESHNRCGVLRAMRKIERAVAATGQVNRRRADMRGVQADFPDTLGAWR